MINVKSEKNIVWVWRIRFALICLLVATASSWLYILMSKLWLYLNALWIIPFIFMYTIYYPIKYKKMSYTISNGYFSVKKGVFYTISESIPIKNIQFVNLYISPLEKIFKICTLRVVGAGGSVSISGLKIQNAEKLSDTLGGINNEK